RTAVPRGLFTEFGRARAGAVVAVVVDDEDTEVTGVILGEERGQRDRQGLRLVPRRHDSGNRRPSFRRRPGAARQALVGEPEAAMRRNEVAPRGGADHTDDPKSKHTLKFSTVLTVNQTPSLVPSHIRLVPSHIRSITRRVGESIDSQPPC